MRQGIFLLRRIESEKWRIETRNWWIESKFWWIETWSWRIEPLWMGSFFGKYTNKKTTSFERARGMNVSFYRFILSKMKVLASCFFSTSVSTMIKESCIFHNCCCSTRFVLQFYHRIVRKFYLVGFWKIRLRFLTLCLPPSFNLLYYLFLYHVLYYNRKDSSTQKMKFKLK